MHANADWSTATCKIVSGAEMNPFSTLMKITMSTTISNKQADSKHKIVDNVDMCCACTTDDRSELLQFYKK